MNVNTRPCQCVKSASMNFCLYLHDDIEQMVTKQKLQQTFYKHCKKWVRQKDKQLGQKKSMAWTKQRNSLDKHCLSISSNQSIKYSLICNIIYK